MPYSYTWLRLVLITSTSQLVYPGNALHAQPDLGSTNTDCVRHLFSAMNAPTNRITLLAFGDSMSESYDISAQYFLFKRLRDQYGKGGITFYNVFNSALSVLGGDANVSEPTSNWWTRHFIVPAGGFVYWWNQWDSTQSVLSDKVGLFWIAQTNGGAFTLSASSNGGPWASLLTLEGYASEPKGCYTNVALPRDKYRLRVDSLNGTNVILGPRYLDSGAVGGVDIAFMAQGGANLNEVFKLSTNVLYPILSAIDPQLVVVHMKEVGDIGTDSLSNRLNDLELLWRNCVTNGDVVYVGTPWEAADLTTNRTVAQNTLVRQAAVENGRAYVDCMSPMVSYQWMRNQGYMRDTIHLSASGNQVLADILWKELGLYALGLDRTLYCEWNGNALVLRWATRTKIVFELLRSSNLRNWEVVHTALGDGTMHYWTNSASGDCDAFRLRLQQE